MRIPLPPVNLLFFRNGSSFLFSYIEDFCGRLLILKSWLAVDWGRTWGGARRTSRRRCWRHRGSCRWGRWWWNGENTSRAVWGCKMMHLDAGLFFWLVSNHAPSLTDKNRQRWTVKHWREARETVELDSFQVSQFWVEYLGWGFLKQIFCLVFRFCITFLMTVNLLIFNWPVYGKMWSCLLIE